MIFWLVVEPTPPNNMSELGLFPGIMTFPTELNNIEYIGYIQRFKPPGGCYETANINGSIKAYFHHGTSDGTNQGVPSQTKRVPGEKHRTALCNQSQMLHVWYIYLHVGDF